MIDSDCISSNAAVSNSSPAITAAKCTCYTRLRVTHGPAVPMDFVRCSLYGTSCNGRRRLFHRGNFFSNECIFVFYILQGAASCNMDHTPKYSNPAGVLSSIIFTFSNFNISPWRIITVIRITLGPDPWGNKLETGGRIFKMKKNCSEAQTEVFY
jgi:hypothetical protein